MFWPPPLFSCGPLAACAGEGANGEGANEGRTAQRLEEFMKCDLQRQVMMWQREAGTLGGREIFRRGWVSFCKSGLTQILLLELNLGVGDGAIELLELGGKDVGATVAGHGITLPIEEAAEPSATEERVNMYEAIDLGYEDVENAEAYLARGLGTRTSGNQSRVPETNVTLRIHGPPCPLHAAYQTAV
ncbi:hypothetical protein B0H13DRAFT_1873851 [Mycena leptocephala]|nr:hypothetical protein B0H13DRAFT_1873851 [Mycena leptocephala]